MDIDLRVRDGDCPANDYRMHRGSVTVEEATVEIDKWRDHIVKVPGSL